MHSSSTYPKIVICSLICVVLIPVVFLFAATTSNGRFRNSDLSALLDRTKHNFGIVEMGPALKCTFRITNTTNESITVQKIKTDCGCMAHSIEAHSIKPGDFHNLEIAIRTSGFRPPYRLRKKALIEIEMAGKSHIVPLTLSADLREDILFRPSELSFSSDDSLSSKPARVTIRRDVLSTQDFSTVRVIMENTSFRIQEIHRSEEEIRLAVQPVQNNLTNQPSSIEVRFESRGVTKKVSLPVVMPISIANVEIIPSSYVASFTEELSRDQLKENSSQEFELHSQVGEHVVITKIESSDPSAKTPFGWQISPKESHCFRVWANSPREGIASMVLVVSYDLTIEGRTVSGTLPLTAHSLTTRSSFTTDSNLPFSSGSVAIRTHGFHGPKASSRYVY